MSDYPMMIPEVVLKRLERYIKPEAVRDVINRPAECWGGKTAVEYAVEHGWEAVLWQFEKTFSYETTA